VHDGGTAIVYVDQSDAIHAGDWILLGSWTFTSTGSVTLEQSTTGSISADAVKWSEAPSSRCVEDGPVGYWDRTNTITVKILSGSLSTHSAADVLQGLNHALIGSEVVAFQTATLVSGTTYTLSNLLRGLRGTEASIATHGPMERFTLIEQAKLGFQDMNLEDIGRTVYYKGASPGSVEDDIEVNSFRFQGGTITPFPPAQLSAVDYGSYLSSGPGILFSWKMRTRNVVNIFNTTAWGVPDLEGAGYRIEAYHATRLVQSFVTFGTSLYYTTAMQIANGFSVGDQITLKVYKTSLKVGNGRPAEITTTCTV